MQVSNVVRNSHSPKMDSTSAMRGETERGLGSKKRKIGFSDPLQLDGGGEISLSNSFGMLDVSHGFTRAPTDDLSFMDMLTSENSISQPFDLVSSNEPQLGMESLMLSSDDSQNSLCDPSLERGRHPLSVTQFLDAMRASGENISLATPSTLSSSTDARLSGAAPAMGNPLTCSQIEREFIQEGLLGFGSYPIAPTPSTYESQQRIDLRKPIGAQQQPTTPRRSSVPSSPYPDPSISLETPSPLISRVTDFESSLESKLREMEFQQSRAIDNLHNRMEVDRLVQIQNDIKKQIDYSLIQLRRINDTHVLHSGDAYMAATLVDLLEIHAKRLKVFQEELFQEQNAHSGNIKPVAALVIVKQPFPYSIKQLKPINAPLEVHLFTGAKVQIQKLGQVKAELINEDLNPRLKRGNPSPSVQYGNENMNTETQVSVLKRVTFPHGSRMKPINVRFSQEVRMDGTLVYLQSEPSKPFIVMTNDGQRCTTEGILLKKQIFSERSEVPWPAFANAIQLHYLRATKQDPMRPIRPLTFKDLEYLHVQRLQQRAAIANDDFDAFWEWFGKIVYKIRNPQKHLLPMWMDGLIYGFLSREDSDSILHTANAMAGSFLVRFSDRCKGQFVVVYVQNKATGNGRQPQKKVKHYLIKEEDIEKKGSLPDFLRGCENLQYLLQVVRDPETRVVTLRPKHKDDVMSRYYSREKSEPLPAGYEPESP